MRFSAAAPLALLGAAAACAAPVFDEKGGGGGGEGGGGGGKGGCPLFYVQPTEFSKFLRGHVYAQIDMVVMGIYLLADTFSLDGSLLEPTSPKRASILEGFFDAIEPLVPSVPPLPPSFEDGVVQKWLANVAEETHERLSEEFEMTLADVVQLQKWGPMVRRLANALGNLASLEEPNPLELHGNLLGTLLDIGPKFEVAIQLQAPEAEALAGLVDRAAENLDALLEPAGRLCYPPAEDSLIQPFNAHTLREFFDLHADADHLCYPPPDDSFLQHLDALTLSEFFADAEQLNSFLQRFGARKLPADPESVPEVIDWLPDAPWARHPRDDAPWDLGEDAWTQRVTRGGSPHPR